MNSTMLFILTVVSMAIWVMVSRESMRELKDKEKNTGKMMTLIAAGSLTTIFLLVSLYQKL
ncbi:hypothetical protein ABNB59_18140 [Paenibacillus larvae]|uniref:DUF3953 domain-containing protein n=2 Tax=Paenibacillus larvae TaxID=1464 RepID=A0A2L1UIV2_9BACL|nr:hypothetical protein [Paenibacillus larvae]AQR78366.1 hypothetical protein BXP28_14640 [Paenibacillus larvae subsp. larvae]AQT84621.1 hypothetical protein B1222_09815 [Paenibacillus larvae subsp. pulvifaciens]AQZ46621.1 hypothetical protein B5S25_08335 [Paenibacillus larvae subsp. pulvifaciens]AVF20406.1 hypothetical protein ERICI_00471 [Paenibacillus larvae subsp. larvae]AVF28350.1 hypothetical protein ERICIII_04286 [Paenibacillus larvae subsp. larvae]